MHIANPESGRVRRVDLKGFDDLRHPSLRALSPDEAKARHLGKVSRQIDFSSASRAIEAFALCVSSMAPMSPPSAAGGEGNSVTVTLRLRRDLYEAIEKQRVRVENASPKGVDVSIESAIRALLHEAIEARTA